LDKRAVSCFLEIANASHDAQADAKALLEPFMSSLPMKPIMSSLKKRDYIQQQRNVGFFDLNTP
jgi:hypothetical protein